MHCLKYYRKNNELLLIEFFDKIKKILLNLIKSRNEGGVCVCVCLLYTSVGDPDPQDPDPRGSLAFLGIRDTQK